MNWNMILSTQWRLEEDFCFIFVAVSMHLHAFILS